jgi:hypothetical protein
MAERAHRKNGDHLKRRIIHLKSAQEIGEAKFGDVVSAMLEHTLEDLGHDAPGVDFGSTPSIFTEPSRSAAARS